MTAVPTKEPDSAPQSAAAPSPFPPIADYAFLSDCHTGALVAPDGAIDWLCIPSFDSPSVFGSLLDRQAGFFRFAPFGISHPTARAYVPGTNVFETTWKTPSGWIVVRDALTLGPRDHEDTVTPHTRPPVRRRRRPHARPHGRVPRRTGRDRPGLRACIRLRPRLPPTWTMVDGGHTADATGAGVTFRLVSDLAIDVEGDTVRGRHELEAGDRAYCALSWAEGLAAPQSFDEAAARIDCDDALLAPVAEQGADPGSPPARSGAAVGADDQGPDLHADRRDGRGAHDLAPRDARRRAELGLPLHLDPGHDLHPPGAPLPQPRLGSGRVHGVRRRPRADGRRVAPDHVRHRRAARPARDDPRRPDRVLGRRARADRQRRVRPAAERRLRRRARLDPPPLAPQRAAAAAALADRAGTGGVRDAGLAATRTRGSGRHAASRSTTSHRS